MEIERYNLYGIKGVSLDHAARRLEEALGVHLVERESSYRGGVYFSVDIGRCEVILQANAEGWEGCKVESKFEEYDVLVYANSVDVDIVARLDSVQEIVLLRSDSA